MSFIRHTLLTKDSILIQWMHCISTVTISADFVFLKYIHHSTYKKGQFATLMFNYYFLFFNINLPEKNGHFMYFSHLRKYI